MITPTNSKQKIGSYPHDECILKDKQSSRYSKPQVTRVFCDKLSMTLAIDNEAEKKYIHEKLVLINKNKYSYRISNNLYKYSYNIILEYGQYLTIQICPKNFDSSYLRICYNPNKTYPGEVQLFIDEIVPGGFIRLITESRCTRCDATVDIIGMNINELIFFRPKVSKTNVFTKHGYIETCYLGDKYSNRQTCLYDKAAHHKYKKNAFINEEKPRIPITRIEVRIKYKIPLLEIARLNNPFSDLYIDYLDKNIFSGESTLFFQYFKDACRYLGPHAVIEKLKKYDYEEYKLFLKKIKESDIPWWKPDEMWDSWEEIFLNYLSPHLKPFDLSMNINEESVA